MMSDREPTPEVIAEIERDYAQLAEHVQIWPICTQCKEPEKYIMRDNPTDGRCEGCRAGFVETEEEAREDALSDEEFDLAVRLYLVARKRMIRRRSLDGVRSYGRGTR